ncbi:MAG: glycosyltransferase family 2 protein [Candidatus Sumerlaeota bacterium]|nr:glycosyltransferase family 2 protein [Candidatus Sumerlaeota bacterium]
MPTLPTASVLVLTYNSAGHIIPCLEALANNGSPEKELLIIDNASKDSTIELIQSRFPHVRLIVNPANFGVAGGWNQGWRETGGEIVVFLNPDVTVTPGWLRAIQETFAARAEADVVGIKLLYPNGNMIQHAGAGLRPNGETFHRGWNETDHGQYDAIEPVDCVTGAAWAVRREALQRLGGFDEDYYPAYFEEVDFCARVRARGRQVLYVPAAAAYHHEAATLRRDSPEFVSLHFRMRALFVVKNFELRRILRRALPWELRMHFVERKWAHSRAALASYVWVFPYARQRVWRKLRGLPGRPFDAWAGARGGVPKVIPSSAIEQAERERHV